MTAVYLDFGFALPDGQLLARGTEMQQAPLNYADGSNPAPDHTLVSLTRSVQAFGIEMNGDGVSNLMDALLLSDQVVNQVRRIFEPYSIDVFAASARSLEDVRNRLSAGSNDAYIFVGGNDPGGTLFGSANLDRAERNGSVVRNSIDNLGFVYAADVLRLNGMTPVTALSRVAAHEAAHTFGLDHTQATTTLSSGFLMGTPAAGMDTRRFNTVNFLSRFDMPSEGNTNIQFNSHDEMVRAVGARYNTSYVSGSGFHDRITITSRGDSFATVFVEAFRDGSFRTLERSTSYVIPEFTTIIVEAGPGNDNIVIDGSINATFRIRGGADNDTVTIINPGRTADVSSAFCSTVGRIYHSDYGETESLVVEGNSTSRLFIQSSTLPLTVRNTGQVNVGKGTLTGITQSIILENNQVTSHLLVNASQETAGRSYAIGDRALSFAASLGVQYSNIGLASISLTAGKGNDSIRVASTPQMAFNKAQQNTAKVAIQTGIGSDQVFVQASTAPMRITDGGGGDSIWVGRLTQLAPGERSLGSLQNSYVLDSIQHTVHVQSADGQTVLNVLDDDFYDPRSVSLSMEGSTGYIRGLTPTWISGTAARPSIIPTAISYVNGSLRTLNVRTGRGNDTVNVYGTMTNPRIVALGRTADIANTNLMTGSGDDSVIVHGTTGRLQVDTQGASLWDSVVVGAPVLSGNYSGLDAIRGNVIVRGDTHGMGVALEVNDRAGHVSRVQQLYSDRLQTEGLATISYLNLYKLAISGGGYGNVMDVYSTPGLQEFSSTTEIMTGAGTDSLTVFGTTNAVSVHLEEGMASVALGSSTGNLDQISGVVRIDGARSAVREVSVNDTNNTVGRELEFHSGGIDWSGRQHVYFDFGWSPTSTKWNGGSGDDVVTFSGGTGSTVANSGAGDDYYFFTGRDGRLSNLGQFLVSDSSGIDSLFLYDTTETQDQTYILSQAVFTGVTTTGTTINFQNVELVALYQGTGQNLLDLRIDLDYFLII